MDRNFYIVFFSVVVFVFILIMFLLLMGRYNKKYLRKSYMDTRLFVYVVSLSAILFVGTIIYTNQIRSFELINYVIYYLIFISYSLSVMIMLLVSLRPLKKLDINAREIANGKKNLNINFEGAEEFENISKSLNKVQAKYRENDKRLNKKEYEYQKFVPKEYLKYFGNKKIEQLKVGDYVQVKLCTMFCDLRNSYYSSETLSLQDNFNIIKEFLEIIANNVHKNNGFIDKFMGDGVVAIFDSEDDALTCAYQTAKKIDYQNLVSIGKEAIKYGIGLNSGMCVVGIVGQEHQKQFSVVSDVVNLCSRIEELNKILGTRVLMSKNFLSNLKNDYSYRYIGTINFDDLTSNIPMFESLDAYNDAKKILLSKNLQEFESGVRYYEKGDYEKAKQFFALCLKNDSTDNLARFYLNRTNEDMSSKLPYVA